MSDANVSYCRRFLGIVSGSGIFALGLVYGGLKFFRDPKHSTSVSHHLFDFDVIKIAGNFIRSKIFGGAEVALTWVMKDSSFASFLIFFALFFVSLIYNFPLRMLKIIVRHPQNERRNLEVGNVPKMVSAAITASIVTFVGKIHNTDLYVFICGFFITILSSLVIGFVSENTGLVDAIFGGFFGLTVSFFYDKHYSNSLYSAVVCVFAYTAYKQLKVNTENRAIPDSDESRNEDIVRHVGTNIGIEDERELEHMEEGTRRGTSSEVLDHVIQLRGSSASVPRSSGSDQSLRQRHNSYPEIRTDTDINY